LEDLVIRILNLFRVSVFEFRIFKTGGFDEDSFHEDERQWE